jgi:Flp pilus assembly protein TadG
MSIASAASKQNHEKAHGQRGQAILELVPVLSLFLILTFGVIDVGRAIWQQETITGLTREGSDVASRITGVTLQVALQNSANAVINDGAALNLSSNGKVILTAVQNEGTPGSPQFKITGQYATGSLRASSKIGKYNSHGQGNGVNNATLPTETTTIPQPGATLYVTEVFMSYSPITPLGGFVKYTVPSTLYDIAYF